MNNYMNNKNTPNNELTYKIEKDIKERVRKNECFEEILKEYKNLNFSHIWSINKLYKEQTFHLATLDFEIASIYFVNYCGYEKNTIYTIKINQIYELLDNLINHPYEKRKFSEKEKKIIINSIKQDFIDYA